MKKISIIVCLIVFSFLVSGFTHGESGEVGQCATDEETGLRVCIFPLGFSVERFADPKVSGEDLLPEKMVNLYPKISRKGTKASGKYSVTYSYCFKIAGGFGCNRINIRVE